MLSSLAMNATLSDPKPAASKPKKSYTSLADSQLTWPHYIFQWICIKLIHLYTVLNYDLRILGKENQPKGFQSYIVACNHVSSLDPPLVSVALCYQPISYMAKMELFEKPLLRYYNILMSSFAVNRDKLELSTIKTALKVLKHGKWSLGIFPEGTRQKDGTVSAPKKGVAYFAKTAWKPVLPLAMVHIPQPNGKKTKIEVRIGRLIPPEEDMDALAEKIQNTIAELAETARREA